MHLEEWRDIPGYEGIYQASRNGEIRTTPGKATSNKRFAHRVWKTRVLKQKVTKRGNGRSDARVSLWKDGKEKTWLVSRLVGLAWCEGFSENMTINHINGNSLDNKAENLEWVSIAENIQKGFATGLFAKTQKPILLSDGVKMYCFESMADASRFLGWNSGYINNCLRKNRAIKDRFNNVYELSFKEVAYESHY
jgi:hypothetical protein